MIGVTDGLEKFLYRRIFRFALNRTDADHAAARRACKGAVGGFLQPLAQALMNGGRIFKRVERNGADGAAIIVDSFTKCLFLIAESGIKARRRDADGGREIVDLGAFIALGPENLHHLVQRRIAVEAARTSAWNHFSPFL